MANENSSLNAAKRNKKDEFYTQSVDIEKELHHHRNHFNNKVVYCNCDDPYVSAFFEYFTKNFELLGLKKLITTCYKSQRMGLFSQNDSEEGIKLEYTGGAPNNLPTPDDIGITPLKDDGDFRSQECIDILKKADIVVTNPPFSLFRQYISQLVEYDKQFIIIGNLNAITCKDVFPLVKDNKLWFGQSISSGDREFGVPADYPLNSAGSRVDEGGNQFIRVKGVRWFTNMDTPKRHEDLILYKIYSPEEYPTYDNYDAIEVSKTKDIPMDYEGVMGVPITFLDKYNPDQFEIVGLTTSGSDRTTKIYAAHIQVGADGSRSLVTTLNGRAALKVDSAPHGKTHYIVDNNYYVKLYARILIRRRTS